MPDYFCELRHRLLLLSSASGIKNEEKMDTFFKVLKQYYVSLIPRWKEAFSGGGDDLTSGLSS